MVGGQGGKTFYGFGEKHFCGHFCKQKTDILKEGGSFTMAVGGKGFAIKEFLMRSFQRKSRDVSVTYAVAYHGLEDLKEMDIVGERILDIVGKRILG